MLFRPNSGYPHFHFADGLHSLQSVFFSVPYHNNIKLLAQLIDVNYVVSFLSSFIYSALWESIDVKFF